MILAVRFTDINQMDDMDIVVDKFSDEVVYQDKKELNDNETIFVKIFADGFASYGLHKKADPWHNNQPYTWSSRAEVINEYLGLNGTKWELASWDAGVSEGIGTCKFARGILLSLCLELAEANQDIMHYGLMAFYNRRGKSVRIIKPKSGIVLTNRTHRVQSPTDKYWYDLYLEASDGSWLSVQDVSNWVLAKHKMWCLREWLGRTL